MPGSLVNRLRLCLGWCAAAFAAMRTSNMLEPLNRELKRRTRVVSIFPNDEAPLRLASSVLMETEGV